MPGDKFVGGASIIAGVLPRLAPVADLLSRRWDCRETLMAQDPVDRYAVVKAVPHAPGADGWGEGVPSRALKTETDDRVSLEMHASAARLDAPIGLEGIRTVIWSHGRSDLRVEGVLILAELGTEKAATEPERIARAREFAGNEIRQAAVWGLGKAGTRSYRRLVIFIADEDDGVALHAIGAFGHDTPPDVINVLVSRLSGRDTRESAAASAALKIIGSDEALAAVTRALKQGVGDETWLVATLGRFPAARVRSALAGDRLLTRVAPLLALGPEENWIARPSIAGDLDFLLKQHL
ncbi:MAG: hypothetical protein PHP88_01575 [bacterium]|nr:hypothetical protein [bacterium]